MITQSKLKSQLNYDPDTGLFTWIKSFPKRPIGSVAGCKDTQGYISIGLNNKIYRAHRLAWLYEYGEFPKDCLDHVNRIKDDNRLCNLRECCNSENQWNTGICKNNTSGIKGVAWYERTQSYRVRVRVNGKQKHLGYFKDIELAKITAETARLKFHKQFVNHGESNVN